ncbi:MAG TPA: hypothetical protein PLD47_02985 [Aggregatilineales bacterium]|nr:hypothetical protein [Anaerolineales bacterium]HRE46664.1 hypothetical protein [Aggregatilineales bacterium]
MVRGRDLLSAAVPGVVILGAAFVWLLASLNRLPPVMGDLLGRGYPAILIMLGLMLLIGRRVRFGNALAVGLTGIFVVGVAVIAYNRQSGEFREDYSEPIAFTVLPEIRTITATVTMGRTEITIKPAPAGDRRITGIFTGSLESLVTADFQVSGTTATFTLIERSRSAVPLLDQVGRGRLTLFLPEGTTFETLTVIGTDGDIGFEGETLAFRGVSLRTGQGSIKATFPALPGVIGDLIAPRGAVQITIPSTIAAQIALRGGGASTPHFPNERYTLRIDNVLVPKTDAQMQVTIEGSAIVIQ